MNLPTNLNTLLQYGLIAEVANTYEFVVAGRYVASTCKDQGFIIGTYFRPPQNQDMFQVLIVPRNSWFLVL